MTGRFIVLEGPDGAGTTTQARALSAALSARGRQVHVTAEPSTGPIGKHIRALLGADKPTGDGWRTLALLFAADRLHHVQHEIEPKLAAGVDVISDRYVLSSLVYQSLNVELDWVATLNQYARPADLTLVVDIDPEEAARRRSARAGAEEIFDAIDQQRRVREGYLSLAHRVGAQVVSGQGTPSVVTERLLAAIDAL